MSNSTPGQELPEKATEVGAGDDLLAGRLAELTHREAALRRITEAVEEHRKRLEERERALQSVAPEAAPADDRLAEAVRRAERAEQRVRDLVERVAELEARQEPESPPVDENPGLEPEAAPELLAAYTLERLERLLQDAELRGDTRVEEWAYYLPLLRQHAAPDGRLPAQFAPLIDGVFGI